MRRDERGAVAVLAAFVLVIVLAVAAMVVDLGMQRVARTDMQSLADVVALDLARDLDGRTVAQLQPVVSSDAVASIARNLATVGTRPTATVELGTASSTGAFVALASGSPTAVRVSVGTRVAFAFGGITGKDSGAASRSAMAVASSNACFRLGSFAGALRSGDSAVAGVFEALVGDPDALGVNLRSVSYQGLLTSYVDLGLLAAQLGAASPQALVDRGDISVQQLLSAGARVLDAQGSSSASVILGAIAAKTSSTATVGLGDILSLGNGSALGSSVNVIDLVGAAALSAGEHTQLANQNNLLDTGVVWSTPHASSGDVGLSVIEPPREGCGAPGTATASTGQVRIATDFGFNLPNKVSGFSGLSVGTVADPTSTQGTIHVDAGLAGANGVLSGVTCGSAVETRVRVDTRLMTATITLPFRVKGTLSVAGLGLVTVDLQATASTSVSTAASTGSTDTAYDVPPHDYTDPQSSPGSNGYVGLSPPKVSIDLAHSSATLLGVPWKIDLGPQGLGPLVSALTSSVIVTSLAEVTTNINAAVTPLAKLLGIQLAGADVFGVPTPTCAQPRLAG
ncbi:pilus assembly protein TadG-related protein [Nocardioides montaniterrae]